MPKQSLFIYWEWGQYYSGCPTSYGRSRTRQTFSSFFFELVRRKNERKTVFLLGNFSFLFFFIYFFFFKGSRGFFFFFFFFFGFLFIDLFFLPEPAVFRTVGTKSAPNFTAQRTYQNPKLFALSKY